MTARARSRARHWVDRGERLATTLLAPGGLRALVAWRPPSLAAFRLVRGVAREGVVPATVIDVGANVGQFARAALGTWPGAHVIAFEPLADVAAALEATVGRAGSLEVHAVALGRVDGTTSFVRHEQTRSSSVLAVAPAPAGSEGEPWAREREVVTVPMRRLDSVLGGRHLDRPVLVKLDVQGTELDVIAGAEGTLGQADAVVVEVAFDERYAGQPVFGAVDGALRALGWQLARPLDWWRDRDGLVAEMDCLYTKGARQ